MIDLRQVQAFGSSDGEDRGGMSQTVSRTCVCRHHYNIDDCPICRTIEECARVYGEYIEFLEGELPTLYGLAFAHGYVCPQERVKRGEELRAAIRALKDKND